MFPHLCCICALEVQYMQVLNPKLHLLGQKATFKVIDTSTF